ncbi:GlxA family transcriptional regulator [Pigmentiphaga aceris]|uniref:GlxA family transcriptional regulator n=1 Tax=Pigmentiphaga aceris TaxID=1940612 RepID=A0A5C0B6G9_9BURK|nr:GlxA family transcriptional regulator [Pigmentiphaga aceris]QEI08197.1 GlxA family transcriptional regulator [Pigmentiphaga aceris]
MHRIGYVLADGFQVMALGSQAVFEFANLVVGEPWYGVQNYSANGGEVRSSLGLTVGTRQLTSRSSADTWLVGGVLDPVNVLPSKAVVDFVRRVASKARRVGGLCTGGFVLAAAGLLDGRRATTHWSYADAMQRRHPDIQVESDRIFITDGAVWTSAGMTAGLDLALGMVEKDLGAEVARSVAHRLVMNQRRAGGQSQHSEMLKLAPKSDRIQQALDYARQHLAEDLSVEQLAERVHLSPRQFSRVFTAETGQSPAKAIEALRLEAARNMIEQSRHSLETIAQETGFRDRRHLREAFIRGFGRAPQLMRRDARPSA